MVNSPLSLAAIIFVALRRRGQFFRFTLVHIMLQWSKETSHRKGKQLQDLFVKICLNRKQGKKKIGYY